ncbi:unnamed protein product [Rotaria socialis]|uniref:Cytochrome c oxidase subunit 7C, mitochondrial n=1 Tax=Rotaria socialis TaxID=392032 RepID=A0A817PYR2_9BILA|nr:unnamed protein product [Rotaria socialis]CAF3171114.1 unnamed protein product [Rotaria socialis]CAF3438540.1 unnamed protein product [Rotaria socialis]CAF3466782.1 unnamed protein product [Rotaria socialis]CAF3750430.1 unnamed protein product [Rotaria socialis]
MASLRSGLALVPRVVGRRQFSLTQRLRLKDNWDQECLPGANAPFDINNKWSLAIKMVLYVTSAVAIPFVAMRWQLLKKRAG